MREAIMLEVVRFVLAIMTFVGVLWAMPFMLVAVPLSFYDSGALSTRMFKVGVKPITIVVSFLAQENITPDDILDAGSRVF